AILSTALFCAPAMAENARCTDASDRACVIAGLLRDAESVTESRWRDQLYRDAAASMTYDGRIDDAVALIPKIENPDTQAMTVRAIGMAASLYGKLSEGELKAAFEKLGTAAKTIKQPAANAIAFTYIAMAQAFAGLD